MEYYNLAIDLLTNPKHSKWISQVLLAADVVLCFFIIWKVPYTEIDWQTYMTQVSLFLNGERDYTLLKGPTGPLVYPAAHVYIYSFLYMLTSAGTNIRLAQLIFMLLYLSTLAIVLACYRLAKAPPYVLVLLVGSKRLHSVFLLRLFNDGFVAGAFWVATYALICRVWTIGAMAFTWGVGVKMSLLLAAPAVGVVVLQGAGWEKAVRIGLLMVQLQVALAFPFLCVNAPAYVSRAFEFTRQFLFKWTVNWRFVGEETFLSRRFSLVLLGAHASLLAVFAVTRWITPSGKSLLDFLHTAARPLPPRETLQTSVGVTPSFILTTMLTAMTIGLLCARSLHYQFFAYLAWASPFLLWKAGFHPVLIYAIWAAQEWAWNVYPSTDVSSIVVVSALAVQIVGVWWGTRKDFGEVDKSRQDTSEQKQHAR